MGATFFNLNDLHDEYRHRSHVSRIPRYVFDLMGNDDDDAGVDAIDADGAADAATMIMIVAMMPI